MKKRKIFFKENEQLEIAEALRTIRTNLSFLNEKEKGRVILFTSVSPNEGKSFLAANYAASIGITGKKALLIDCDIRRPRLHENFKINFDKGFESVLKGEISIEEAIKKEVFKNLDILPSKSVKENVTELIVGDKIKEVIDSLRDRYNTIILDNPPIGVASDSVILSKHSDGVVVVVAYDQVSKKELEFAKKMLMNARANIYGFIVNKVERSSLSYGNYGHYHNYYSYYKEYYSEDNKEKPHHSKNKKNSFKKFLHDLKDEYKRHLTGDLKGRKRR